MNMTEYIEVEKDHHGSATLWLKRPDVKNAFDDQLIVQLIEVLDDLAQDPDLRLLIIRGRGTHFSSGADLKWMERAGHYSHDDNLSDALILARLMATLDQFPHPTIAYAHGGAFGGALGLLACCDIVLADPQTTFSVSEVRLGLVPAVIGPYLVRAIGIRQARRYFLSGERFRAQEAKHMGLVHELVTEEKAHETLELFAHDILKGGPQAVNSTKAMLHLLATEVLEESIQEMAQLIAEVRSGEEAEVGLKAFFDKKAPPWVPRKKHD